MSSPTPGKPADESDETGGDPSGSDPGSDAISDPGRDATSASSAEESSDMTDAFAHEDEDDSMDGSDSDSSSAIDLGGACPLEPELPLLLYAGSATRGEADGELESEEREKLEAHVRKCSRCEGVLSELRAASSALDKAPLVAPRAEKWSKLKSNVLARAAVAAEAGKALPAPAPAVPKGRPPKKQLTAKLASNPNDAIAAMVCGTFEEDLLFLQDLEPARRAEVVAHAAGCDRCREAQVAFASVVGNLQAVEVEWPAMDAWDALKSNVLAQVGIEAAATAPRDRTATAATKRPALVPARPVTLEAPSTGRRLGGFVFRAAAVIGVFALGVYASDAVRSVGPDGIRRAYYEAGASGDLAVATQNYELVVREGTTRPELKSEVDEALVQLAALHRYNTAIKAAALTPDTKRAELLNVIAQFPATRAARFAVTEYTRDLESRKDDQPRTPGLKVTPLFQPTSGFDPDKYNIKDDHLAQNPLVIVLWDPAKCAEHLVKLQDRVPEGEQHDVQTVIAAATFQKATDSRTDPQVAKLDLQKVLDKTDTSSPLNLEARKRLDALTAATGN